MTFELLVFCLVVAVVASPFVRAADALSPVRMFLYGWLIALVSTVAGMVAYDEEISWLTAAVISLAILAFVAGARLGTAGSKSVSQAEVGRLGVVDQAALVVLALLSLGGVVYVLADLSVGTGLLLRGGFSEGLQEIRTEKWDSLFAGEVSVAPLRSVCIAAGLIMATAGPSFLRRGNRLLASVAGAAVLALALESFLEGGRFTLGVLCVTLFVSAALTRRKGDGRTIFTAPRVLVGAAVGFYFFIIFPTQRNPDLVNGLDRYLAFLGAAHLSPAVTNISARDGLTWVGVFAYATSYFSHGVDKLNFFLSHTDVTTWHMFGLYNVPQISQVMSIFSDAVTPWHQARLDIASLMARQGWALNPWATGIRDLAIDFGLVGAVLTTFLFGFVSQRAYLKAKNSPSDFWLVIAAYMSVSALTFAFLSPLQVRLVSNGLWFLGVILVCRHIVQRSTSRTDTAKDTPFWRLEARANQYGWRRPVAACVSSRPGA